MSPKTSRVQELLLRVGTITADDLAALSDGEKAELLLNVQRLATIDFLTGLPTRRPFEDELKRSIRRLRFGRKPFVLGIVDVDRFKDVNDRYGHPTGDIVLREVARCLLHGARPGDLVCRWGGEELALFFADVGGSEAFSIADNRIRKVIERSLFSSTEGDEIKVTVSIGLAESCLVSSDDDPELQIKVLLALADEALYEAKNNGRNQVRSAKGPKETNRRRWTRQHEVQDERRK